MGERRTGRDQGDGSPEAAAHFCALATPLRNMLRPVQIAL